jgi:hypothetical protein
MSANASKALQHWGKDMPQWVADLAKRCDTSNQSKVAEEMGYSPAVISDTLKNKYTGDLSRVQQAFNSVKNGIKVSCPVQGDISTATCMNNQRKPYNGANFRTVALFRACRSNCPHSQLGA